MSLALAAILKSIEFTLSDILLLSSNIVLLELDNPL